MVTIETGLTNKQYESVEERAWDSVTKTERFLRL